MLIHKNRNALEHGLAVVKDWYGHTMYVWPAELDRARERHTLCPLRSSTGGRLADMPKGLRPDCTMLHPENVAEVFYPAYLDITKVV